MTTTRERHVIVTRRKNKKGEFIAIHYFRPEPGFKKTLSGTNPATAEYQHSLVRAQDAYQRWLAMGRPAAGRRNARGSLLDENGMAVTKPERGTALPVEQSVAWLFRQFQASAQYRSLKPSTARRYDDLLQRMCAQPWPKQGPGAVVGDADFTSVRKDHLVAIRARLTAPSQGNYLIKCVKAVYHWAADVGFSITVNPALRIDPLPEGHYPPWTYDEHDRYCRFWPVGTMQRLAVDIALYSGARVIDLHKLGPENLRSGWLYWTEGKNMDTVALKSRSKGNKHREWKCHAALLTSIGATPHGLTRFIIRPDGQPYATPDRLGRAIVRWAKAAGVNKSAHGIRKLGAVLLADAGAGLLEIRDFLGHSSFAEAQTYIASRDQRRSSRRAVALMDIAKAAKATA